MNHPPRVCVFCSVEKRFEPFYRTVRQHYPDAHVVVILRNGIQLTEAERDLVDKVQELELQSFSLTRFGGLIRMVRRLREGKYDQLIVLFDSLKLRVLSAFSGATRCSVWKEDGRMVIIPASLLRSMSQIARLRAIGYWKLSRVWLSSRLLPVRPRAK